jgi:hypothetical protein
MLAALIAAPNLLWQADHGWPQIEMAQAISERIGAENRATLLPGQVVLLGLLGGVLLVAGTMALVRRPELRTFRPLLSSWAVAVALTFATGGRPYYPLGFATVIALVGVVDGRLRTRTVWVLATVNLVMLATAALPMLPPSALADYPPAAINETLAESIGWEELTDTVADAAHQLPVDERSRVIILTGSYGEAGAIERFGPERGLPLPYSGHNSYASFRRPTDASAPVLAVRFDVEDLAAFFDSCEELTRFDNRYDVDNEVRGTPLLLCRGLHGTWEEVWEQLSFLS